MAFSCTDCRIFLSAAGCVKNCKAFLKCKELYPVTVEERRLRHLPRTENEKRQVAYMANVAGRCQERVAA
jgi:hypothetical protein